MDDPIYSPDGKFIWNGTAWKPVPSDEVQSINLQDSVIAGDVVSNTNIQSSDADVVRAAIEEAGKILKTTLNENQTESSLDETAKETEVVWVPSPHSEVESLDEKLVKMKQVRREKRKKAWLWASSFTLFVVCLLIAMTLVSEGVFDEEVRYSTVTTETSAIISFESLQTDGGPSGRDIVLEVYFDDDNSGEFEDGERCSTIIRHHSDQSDYNLNKNCEFTTKTIDRLTNENPVSITVCVYEQSSGDNFDIYSGDSEGGSCVIFRGIYLNYAHGYDFYQCDYDGEIYTKRGSPYNISPSGLDDGDSNLWNAKFTSTVTIEDTKRCYSNS